MKSNEFLIEHSLENGFRIVPVFTPGTILYKSKERFVQDSLVETRLTGYIFTCNDEKEVEKWVESMRQLNKNAIHEEDDK